jgi:alkylation response protein AidB-like acyl-CoA dehydrogenase
VKLFDSPATHTYRAELVAFLDEHAPQLPALWGAGAGWDEIPEWGRRWQATLFDHGWLVPENPPEFGGRHASREQLLIYLDEIVRRGLPRSLHFPGYAIVAPTLLQFGDSDQRSLATRALRGDDVWCIGMSEPDAGSDLSRLRTELAPTSDGFSMRGRKIWTSYAAHAAMCLCYARLGGERRGAGITAVIVDMSAPGVEVHPIRQITGASDFAEVVFDDVAISTASVIGGEGAGWPIARASLDHERRGLGIEWLAGIARLATAVLAGGLDPITGVIDPRAAQAYRRAAAVRALGIRELDPVERGRDSSPSLLKLLSSELAQELSDVAVELLGADAVSADGALVGALFRTYADTIGGGTSEIQRDLLARRLLPSHT